MCGVMMAAVKVVSVVWFAGEKAKDVVFSPAASQSEPRLHVRTEGYEAQLFEKERLRVLHRRHTYASLDIADY